MLPICSCFLLLLTDKKKLYAFRGNVKLFLELMNCKMKHAKRRMVQRASANMALLPECLIQLIWEFLPLYDGIMLSRSNWESKRALQKEVDSIRILRRIAKLNGLCIDTQIRQVQSLSCAKSVALRVAAVPHRNQHLTKVCEAVKFLLQYSKVNNLEFSDGICAFALKKMLMISSGKPLARLSLSNCMGYYTCNRQARASLSELSKFRTRHIDVLETYINCDTLSGLLLAISRIQCLKSIRISKTWIQTHQRGELACAIRRCSEISIKKCGLTAMHVYALSPALKNLKIQKLDLSYNTIDCEGINQLFVALSNAKKHVLSVLELEGTFDFVDDEDGYNWDTQKFDTFCTVQSGLEVLNLSANFLDDNFIYDNRKAIKRLKKLETLRLASNFIGDDGVYKLSRLETKLVKLDLNENPIKSIAITHFTSRLFHYIEELDFGNSKLSSQTLFTLADCAEKKIAFTNIKHLSMENCEFTDHHISFIFSLVLKLKRLVFLSLEDNEFSDYAYDFLCEHLENAKISNRCICIWMADNQMDHATSSVPPSPHCIVR